MQYMGGKSRIAKQLAEVIDRVRKPGQLVWDPFCGGLSMAVALSKNGPVWATDVNAALINLYKAVQAGWDPPTLVSRDQYQAAKSLPDADPMKAFCGFGCSFGGKWFGGYANDGTGARNRNGTPSNYALGTKRKLLKEVQRVQRLDCGDFLSVTPRPIECVLYLDPPYRRTTRYNGAPPFDHERFVSRVQDWARYANVFVSEYAFPLGQIVWEGRSSTTINAGKSGKGFDAIERLHYLGPK